MTSSFSAPEQIVILHLSDLHFGKNSRYPFEETQVKQVAKSLATAVNTQSKKRGVAEVPHLIIVTGDIAQTAIVPEYKMALTFFRELAKSFLFSDEDLRRFIFIPGNHDVSWYACSETFSKWSRMDYDQSGLPAAMMEAKFEQYRDFVHNFQGEPNRALSTEIAPSAYIHDFDKWHLSVAALNSCLPITHEQLAGGMSYAPALGTNIDTCQQLMDSWTDRDGRIRIAAIHHNPVGLPPQLQKEIADWLFKKATEGCLDRALVDNFVADTMGFSDAARLKNALTQRQVVLLLHGHQHQEEISSWPWRGAVGGQTHVVATGSLGLKADELPKDQSNQVQVIVLDIKEKTARTYRLAYDPTAPAPDLAKKGYFLPKHDADWEYQPPITLPDRLVCPVRTVSQPLLAPRKMAEFVAHYRARMERVYDVYDLRYVGMVPEGGAERPRNVALHDMYQPLRFAESYQIEHLDEGEYLSANHLIQRKKDLAITGPAGSGKTTWMRYTFCTCISDSRVLPIMIELRRLVASWKKHDPTGDGRSLDAYIEETITEYLGPEWKGCAAWSLNDESGPGPILFVDGWDELGDMGEDLRRKLIAFLDGHKHILAVVTSRPYGVQRPGWADGFDVLDIQPLSDSDIKGLAENFLRHAYRDDPRQQKEQLNSFVVALQRSEGAQPLARLPLLLTMMLLISRSSPLPDKRHQLYQACIENLLTALPNRQENEWVQMTATQWRPEDSEERLRVVARLAAEIQEKHYQQSHRSGSIVFSQEDAISSLPSSWKVEDRRGFLVWLATRAGIIVEREDGTYMFAHLSFQEYLTAWHLMQNTAVADREASFVNLAERENWWETLRLWAALIQRGSFEQLAVLVEALQKRIPLLGFTGCLFADGLGDDRRIQSWAESYAETIAKKWPADTESVAGAWSVTRQQQRKVIVLECFRSRAINKHWLAITQMDAWIGRALGCDVGLPPQGHIMETLRQKTGDGLPMGSVLACKRVFCGLWSYWPGGIAGLLNAWPGTRRLVGLRLQSLAAMRAPRSDVLRVLEGTLKLYHGISDMDVHDSLRRFVLGFQGCCGHNFAGDFGRYFGRYFGPDFVNDFDREFLGNLLRYSNSFFRDGYTQLVDNSESEYRESVGRDFMEDLGEGLERYDTVSYARYFLHCARYFMKDAEKEHSFLARAFPYALSPELSRNFATGEIFAFGRVSLPATLANSKDSPVEEIRMLQIACRIHYGHYGYKHQPDLLNNVIAAYSKEEANLLWPCLARHIAGLASEEERQFLNDLIKYPEHGNPGIADGLKYIVRGDVFFDDGTEATLDDLCAEIGQEPLPYLEPMPVFYH